MRPLFIVALGTTLLSAACVRQERFRFVPATSACFAGTAAPASGPANQRPSLDCRHLQYSMAFIEFDSQGKAFDPNQETAALKLLDRAKALTPSGKIITVVYVHGWKNNASEALPGGKPKDVERFQSALLELGYRAGKAAQAAGVRPVPVVGIYIGWRGKTLMGPNWFTFVSMWGRRNTANRIGSGPDLAPIVNRIIEKTNDGKNSSRVLMIGHSFGARVLEHAVETQKIKLYDTVPETGFVNPRVDLVLYVNSANDARLSMARVQELRAHPVKVRHPDYDAEACSKPSAESEVDEETRAARCREYPLLVAITSKGDLATKYLLPIASRLNSDKNSAPMPIPPSSDEFADPLPPAGIYNRVAAGHFPFLQSHAAREITCRTVAPSTVQREQAKTMEAVIDEAVQKAVEQVLGKTKSIEERKTEARAAASRKAEEDKRRLERALHPVCAATDPSCRFVFRTLGDQPTCFQVDQRAEVDGKPPFNGTAFWIMNVEPSVIKDHGDIWNLSFIEMLGQLMAPRGFFEPGAGRVQLRAAPPLAQEVK